MRAQEVYKRLGQLVRSDMTPVARNLMERGLHLNLIDATSDDEVPPWTTRFLGTLRKCASRASNPSPLNPMLS